MKVINTPITFEEIVMVMINYKTEGLTDWLIVPWAQSGWAVNCWKQLPVKSCRPSEGQQSADSRQSGQTTHWDKDWTDNWLFDWLIDWLIDWSIDWLIDWLIGSQDIWSYPNIRCSSGRWFRNKVSSIIARLVWQNARYLVPCNAP